MWVIILSHKLGSERVMKFGSYRQRCENTEMRIIMQAETKIQRRKKIRQSRRILLYIVIDNPIRVILLSHKLGSDRLNSAAITKDVKIQR